MTIDEAASRLPNSDSGWSVLDFLILLGHRRRLILTITLGTAVLTAVITLILPSRYTAASSILPPQQSSNPGALLSQVAGGGGGGGLAALAGSSLGIKNQIDTYVSMFRSRTIEDEMAVRFDLEKVYKKKNLFDTRKEFENKSTAVAGLKDGIIRVTVEGRTPDEAAAMTNAYVEEFQKLASNVAVTEAAQRRVFFDRQLEESKDSLSKAEQDLKKTELTTGMVQPDRQSRAMIESAAILQGQIAAKEVEVQALSSFATENNPDLIIVKRQVEELRTQLGKYTGDANSVSNLFVPKGKVPEAALDYVRKLREVKYRETIFQALASQYQLAKLDEAKQGAIFQIIDHAVAPDKRSFPQRTILVVVFAMLAFFMTCTWVWLIASLDARRADPEYGPKLAALAAAFSRRRA
jgi:tyrosine-protein kinase Etk/Wzc